MTEMILTRPDFGEMIHVDRLKSGMKELNPDLIFDPGGSLNLWHPNIDRWMGVYLRDQHITSMDRGPMVPEYNVNFSKNGRVIKIGWRHTAEYLVRKGCFSWSAFSRKFNVDYKRHVGHAAELDPAQMKQVILGRG